MKIHLDTARTSSLLKPFLMCRKQGRDVVTRSVLMVPQEDTVLLFATDGISTLRARLPAQVEGETSSIVVYLDSLHTALRSGAETTMLATDSEGSLWSRFYGGKLHLKTFGFSAELFKGQMPRGGKSKEAVNRDLYLKAITALHRIIETTEIPELRYVFFTRQGAFATDGSLVSKVEGSFSELTLRHRDSVMLEKLLSAHTGEIFHLTRFKNRVLVETETTDYVFPLVEKRLPEQHRERPGRSGDFFTLETAHLRKVFRLIAQIPDTSGVLSLDFQDRLTGQVRSRSGHVSTFTLAEEGEGDSSDFNIQTLVKTMLMAVGVFQEDDCVHLGVRTDGSLLMWNDDKALNFSTKPGLDG